MILRADYRLLKKQIMEKRDEITDKELFSSGSYERCQ